MRFLTRQPRPNEPPGGPQLLQALYALREVKKQMVVPIIGGRPAAFAGRCGGGAGGRASLGNMKPMVLARTVQIARPPGQTLVGALIILVLFISAGETLARQAYIQDQLPVPSWGSGHYEFEYDLWTASQLEKATSRIDCLFVGSSMPNLGIDPETFAREYKAQTGQDIVCYNFALNIAGAYTVGAIAQLLADNFHPKMIVYGTTARDYAKETLPRPDRPDPVADTPWVQYQLGRWSLAGWLIDHSYFYRYYLRVQSYPALASEPPGDLYTGIGRYGYNQYLGQSPAFDPQQKPAVSFTNYQVDGTSLKGLERLLALRAEGIQIVLVEMPVQPLYLGVFLDGPDSYRLFLNTISAVAQTNQMPFWRTGEQPAIPVDGWWNANHLNDVGAQVFSQWLGTRVGAAVQHHEISNPVVQAQ